VMYKFVEQLRQTGRMHTSAFRLSAVVNTRGAKVSEVLSYSLRMSFLGMQWLSEGEPRHCISSHTKCMFLWRQIVKHNINLESVGLWNLYIVRSC
jgi:hypothetical protein